MPWTIGVKDPLRDQQRLGQIELHDRALGTSGSQFQSFRHQGRRYGHILDPRSGLPAEGLLSVTVLAPDAATADALSTAFYVMGVEAALDYCRHRPEIAAMLFAAAGNRWELHYCGLGENRPICCGNSGGAEKLTDYAGRTLPPDRVHVGGGVDRRLHVAWRCLFPCRQGKIRIVSCQYQERPMRGKCLTLCVLATVCAWSVFAAAQGPMEGPLYRNWITQRVGFSLVGGQITTNAINNLWMFNLPKQMMTEGPVREQIDLHGNGASGSLAYTYQRRADQAAANSEPRLEFVLDITSEGRFALRYTDKDQPEKCFEFTQMPGQPMTLSLPGSGKPRVLRAPSLWHLLIIDGEECGKGFVPMLESLHPSLRVARTARLAEDELLKLAAVSRKPDRKQWEAWVDQLGDPIIMRRIRADESLRDAGPAVLGYLNRLDMHRLDAEQTARLRRIIARPRRADRRRHRGARGLDAAGRPVDLAGPALAARGIDPPGRSPTVGDPAGRADRRRSQGAARKPGQGPRGPAGTDREVRRPRHEG